MISEVRIFAGKAGNVELPVEVREALNLRDGDQVEVVVRKTRTRATAKEPLAAEEIRGRGRIVADLIRRTTRAF